MITLNDYLYDGHTVLYILQQYAEDLQKSATENHNPIDQTHCNFLLQFRGLLEQNDFLTSQSRRLQDFYEYTAKEFPYLAFTFKGRIKSLIRAEEKFNGYILSYMYDYYLKNHACPPLPELKNQLTRFRDLIAYRLVVSLPKCYVKDEAKRREEELKCLYALANALPEFLEARGFNAELSGYVNPVESELLSDSVRPYYRDYIQNPQNHGYQSLHITFFDNMSRSYFEVQLRTKEMDDYAEIGFANHSAYEKMQERERARREAIPEGENLYFDEAFERISRLQKIELNQLDVNLFGAVNNSLINDGCGLYRGRLILPYEHLSRTHHDSFHHG